MATTVAAFRWLDILETEFDRAFVELDAMIPELDCDELEMIEQAKGKLSTLSSTFAQLVHKAQTIFQNNAKLEAQIIDSRERIINCTCKDSPPSLSPSDQNENYQQNMTRLVRRCQELELENDNLKKTVVALQGEVYGARLASKYLDKELAGRIQQIQLLCKQNMNTDLQKRLWDHIESEIFLHRHKTVARACRGQSSVSNADAANPSSNKPRTAENHTGTAPAHTVSLEIGPTDQLGISITGGQEYGLPILVSTVHPNSVAAKSGKIFAGDSIVSVDGVSLQSYGHTQAVKILSQKMGRVDLEIIPSQLDDDDLDASDLQYNVMSEEVGCKIDKTELETITKATVNQDDASTKSLNGSVESISNSAGEANSQTNSIRSESPTKNVVRVGEYRMANIQSLDDADEPNAVFNSTS